MSSQQATRRACSATAGSGYTLSADTSVEQVGGVRGDDHPGPGQRLEPRHQLVVDTADDGEAGGQRVDEAGGPCRVHLAAALEAGTEDFADPLSGRLRRSPSRGEVPAEHRHRSDQELGQAHDRDELTDRHDPVESEHTGGDAETGDEDRTGGIGDTVETCLGRVGLDRLGVRSPGLFVVATADGDDRAQSFEDAQSLDHIRSGGGSLGDGLLAGDAIDVAAGGRRARPRSPAAARRRESRD